MDETVDQFVAITSSDPSRAQQYLALTDNNLEHAIQLFFDSGGVDMAQTMPDNVAHQTAPAPASQPAYRENPDGTLTIDSDDEDGAGAPLNDPVSTHSVTYNDDEAMARRLQEEAYGSGGAALGEEEVRAPMARTTETLLGPGAEWGGAGHGGDEMRTAFAEQIMAGQRRANARPGIFNQRPSVWDSEGSDPDARRRNLSRATGGASDSSSKSSLLAELFRPPADLMSSLSWDNAREEGKEDEKWIMVNVQDPSIFDCQVLNRDIWKNASIRDTVKESFIFMQFTKDDPRGDQYVNYYFQNKDVEDAYPHIAIVDPRTGEQVKVWSGPPVPKPADFLMELHEFLDRYSLKAFAKNPVATRKPEKKPKEVAKMSEEEMLQMAMQNSLAANGASSSHRADDPDELTRSVHKEQAPADPDAMDFVDTGVPVAAEAQSAEQTVFDRIASDKPHTEPTDPAATTRIQFRWSGGRVVRRFATSDPVQRLYEWLKASPLEGKEGSNFELISMGKNLIESLDQTVEEAGLKNGTIMVEHVDA